MEQKVTATEAGLRLEVLRRAAEEGQRIIVEWAGQPQVVILSLAEYERLKATQREGWQEALEQAIQVGAGIQARRAGHPLTPPEEVIRQCREERDEQLTNLR